MTKNAVILLSGGLDSATVLAMARHEGYRCYALNFDYGQRHRTEMAAAANIAQVMGAEVYQVMRIDLDAFGGSALTDRTLEVPEQRGTGIPITYVPARNTVFLSMALAWAEVLEASDIFIGVNAVDYSGYPDCRPEFVQQFEKLANLATRAGTEDKASHFKVHAPLIHMSKGEIIQTGTVLGVDYAMTVSCYNADAEGRACGVCDSCHYRRQGFDEANIPDPTRYRP